MNLNRWWISCGVVLWFFAVAASLSYAQNEGWGPWGRESRYARKGGMRAAQPEGTHRMSAVTTLPLTLLVTFFQKVISPVDGPTCDFYPTCSAYARQALKKHGLLIGLAMASERITRDHSPRGYELIYRFGRYYVYDPVDHNDFWFTPTRDRVK